MKYMLSVIALMLLLGRFEANAQLPGKKMRFPKFNSKNPFVEPQTPGGPSNSPFRKSTATMPQRPKASGRTNAGGYTDKYGNVLGGSGKPRAYTARYPNQKTAKEKAKQAGNKKAVKHSSPKKGNAHFHPANAKGEKINASKHYEYARRKTVNKINKNNSALKKD